MRLRSALVLSALLLAGALFLPRGHAAPEGGWSLAERVPATALAYAAIEDVGEWDARFQQTAIHKLMSQPDMQAFFQPLMQGLEKMISGRGGPMGKMPGPARELIAQLGHLHGDIAVALLDVDRSSGMPAIIASLDFGAHAEAFTSFMQDLRVQANKERENIRETTRDGRPYWSMEIDRVTVTATVFDSAFIISNSEDALNAAIGGQVESSLASTASYMKVRTQAGGEDLALFLYANMPPITAMIMDQMRSEQSKHMAHALGLDTIHGIGFGIAFAGDGFRDSIIVNAPNADHGYLSLLRYERYKAEALKWVPANAFYYAEGKASLDGYVDRIMKLVAGVEPNATEDMQKMLQGLNQSLGVDLDKDLLAQMDGHTCMYASLPQAGGLYPELVLMLKAKDGATFEANMRRLMDGVAGMITEEGAAIANTRSIRFQQHTLHLLDLEGPRRERMVPFTPTWARFADNWFAITLVPHTMKSLILRVDGTGQPGLAQQEDFKAVMAQRPASAGSVGYLDLQALLTILYDTGVPLLQTLAKPNMLPEGSPPLDFALLPPTELVRPYLRSMGLFVTWDDQGLMFSTHGPIPMGAVLVAAIAAAALVPVMMTRARMDDMPMPPRPGDARTEKKGGMRLKQIQRDVAEMQARDLARHVRSYVLEHGSMPSSLQDLVSKELVRAIPHDPWGQAFSLVVTDAEKKEFKLLSSGPDAQKGTADDILVDG